MYNMNSGEDAAISNDVSPDFLVSELSKEGIINCFLSILVTMLFVLNINTNAFLYLLHSIINNY